MAAPRGLRPCGHKPKRVCSAGESPYRQIRPWCACTLLPMPEVRQILVGNIMDAIKAVVGGFDDHFHSPDGLGALPLVSALYYSRKIRLSIFIFGDRTDLWERNKKAPMTKGDREGFRANPASTSMKTESGAAARRAARAGSRSFRARSWIGAGQIRDSSQICRSASPRYRPKPQ